jgi:hypothetical protein
MGSVSRLPVMRTLALSAVALAIGTASATTVLAQTTPQPTSTSLAPATPSPVALGPAGPPRLGGPGRPCGPLYGAALSQALTEAKADRDAANGKMDLTTVDALLGQAEQLIGQASPNLGSTDLAAALKAQQQASAASGEIRAADGEMLADVGSALPSQANRPSPPTPPTGAPSPQIGASHDLAGSHQAIVDGLGFAKANTGIDVSVPSDAASPLYKEAYAAYQAGQYDTARQFAHTATTAAHAAHDLLLAGGATEAPVTVPAPSF